MNDLDALQGFIFEEAHVRGQLVRLEHSYQRVLTQHPYPPIIQHFLGEALASCLLLIGNLKFEGEISLQFQGDTRFPLLLVQCCHQLNLRAFAQYKDQLQDEDYAQAFLQGKLVITLSPYHNTQVYQSIVPLLSTSMSENLTHYFEQSEQIATKIWLAADETKVAGMMLQLMPDSSVEEHRQAERQLFWEYAVHMGETLTPHELLNLDNELLLQRLYHETELRLFESHAARFRCRCTPEKMKQAVGLLGEEDAKKLLDEQGMVEVHCDFCNKHYTFDPIDVALLFKK